MGLEKSFPLLLTCIENKFTKTVKPVKNSHSKIDKIKILMTNGSLMKVKIISNLQYF